MAKIRNQRICPVENAGGLDNRLRKLLQNPYKILKPYINKGMTVLDLGCGPGYFAIEIAKMLENSGKVIAADLQEGMLEKLRVKLKSSSFKQMIELRQCEVNSICITEKVDFILAFYMIHEVPDHTRLFEELSSILKQNAQIFIIEPKFHVSHRSFKEMIELLERFGFKIITRPKVFFSRAVLMNKPV